jgi:imidazolonepropionase-like amidohydrolase
VGSAAHSQRWSTLVKEDVVATTPTTYGQRVLIKNASIFDGISDRLFTGHVLIEGKIVVAVDSSPIIADATVIDAAGRVLMPGMTDAHVHLVGAANTYHDLLGASHTHIAANTLARCKDMLLRGFTTVRDMGGDTAGIQHVIDREPALGPRIYPSQAAISQTSGHGDFGFVDQPSTTLGGAPSRAEMLGLMRVVDGVDRVLAAVREQLRMGASQIKVMAGGGVSSRYDPLYTMQFSAPELRAAVDAAQDYGTYVAAHVYTAEGIQRALRAGVKSIEHGHLADERSIVGLAENDVFLSTQPFTESDHTFTNPVMIAKHRDICDGTERLFRWAKKHGVKLAWGTDLLFEPDQMGRQSEMITRLGDHFTNVAALKMITSGNAALFRLAGNRDPYQDARLGEITDGAWADLLLIDGDPTSDLALLGDPDTNLKLIIKDGAIVKNIMP